MQQSSIWSNEAVIADALCREPELDYICGGIPMRFSRWRHFVGSYEVPALPSPMFVLHLAGKPDVRFWDRDGWSESTTFPGAATIVPAGRKTRWLVNGELDVATFTFGGGEDWDRSQHQFNSMKFAYADPLGAALTEQILGQIWHSEGAQDDDYVDSLLAMLSKHLMSGRSTAGRMRYPTSGTSPYRIHKVMNAIMADPSLPHSLAELASLAGITESHLCRVFKESVGTTVHNFLLTARLDRARQLLAKADLPVSQIAELSGFAGASQFARAFRQHVGESPSDYRIRIC